MTPQDRELQKRESREQDDRRRVLENRLLDLLNAFTTVFEFIVAAFKSAAIIGAGTTALYYLWKWLMGG